MKITVTGRKIKITEGLHGHLNKKLNEAITNLGDAADVQVVLSVEKYRHFAEFTLRTKGFTLHSHDETNDLYVSVDKALEKMKKQLRKQKDKANNLRIKQLQFKKSNSELISAFSK